MAAHKLAVWSLAALAATETWLWFNKVRHRRRPLPRCRHGHHFADCPDCSKD